jgi:hypothetical protein
MPSIAIVLMDNSMFQKAATALDEEQLLTRVEASRYLSGDWHIPTSVALLAKLAVTGGGPEYRKAGRTPLYPQDALDSYARSKLSKRVRSTAELRSADVTS